MFTWDQLLNPERLGSDPTKNDDVAFDSDYKRIVTSPSFRRLQDKTQVFPLERHDFVHTRLTHSIEVAMLARELASKIIINPYTQKIPIHYKEKICRVLESASLLHDIGNPPFGHFGEDVIRSWFKTNLKSFLQDKLPEQIDIDAFIENYQSDFMQFDGNAQALRIITKLHYFSGEPGMHLTAPTINTIIKYTRSSAMPDAKITKKIIDKKIGYFKADEQTFRKVTSITGVSNARHPLTFILEAADDIAYLTADIEDALKKELFSFDFFADKMAAYCHEHTGLKENRFLADVLETQLSKEIKNQEELVNQCFFDIRQKLIAAASYTFNANYDAIMKGEYNADLFKASYAEKLHAFLGSFALQHIFSNKHILKLEISGHTILTFLLNTFIAAVLPYADLNQIHNKLDKKLVALISESHKQIYTLFAKDQPPEYQLYLRLLMVTDFISGMTDSYAHDLYLTLSGYNI
ncbi:dGTP triphosphohydrolase [Conservatibacter flavescens]|uniref:Deoxyguanosinetriphosphate triphosphohydrolase n=1 Tax=Conservatibacter flavescens TaxID=28161 RepID=A0A2M8S1E8_9PAST|nr:dNTP triphosphohydrolase [Conservatibacter flavescens]PJG84981.1 deoxyguanosinetriphosphate triphosphohydrolase [Conservatibacter flavescens]